MQLKSHWIVKRSDNSLHWVVHHVEQSWVYEDADNVHDDDDNAGVDNVGENNLHWVFFHHLEGLWGYADTGDVEETRAGRLWHSLLVMMGISFVFGQLNAIVEALFSQTSSHRFISLQCVCSLSLFLASVVFIINAWMSTFTSSKVILIIFSQTPGGRCRTWTRCEEAEWEVIRRLLLTLPMGSVRLVIVFVFVFVVRFSCIFSQTLFSRPLSWSHTAPWCQK